MLFMVFSLTRALLEQTWLFTNFRQACTLPGTSDCECFFSFLERGGMVVITHVASAFISSASQLSIWLKSYSRLLPPSSFSNQLNLNATPEHGRIEIQKFPLSRHENRGLEQGYERVETPEHGLTQISRNLEQPKATPEHGQLGFGGFPLSRHENRGLESGV